jgi:hypothetical protein
MTIRSRSRHLPKRNFQLNCELNLPQFINGMRLQLIRNAADASVCTFAHANMLVNLYSISIYSVVYDVHSPSGSE